MSHDPVMTFTRSDHLSSEYGDWVIFMIAMFLVNIGVHIQQSVKTAITQMLIISVGVGKILKSLR